MTVKRTFDIFQDDATGELNHVEILSIFHKQIGKQYRKFANCKCYCGKLFTSNFYSISKGLTKSCGCYGIYKRRLKTTKYIYNEEFFKDRTSHSEYVIGLIVADGNLHSRKNIISIGLQTKDNYLLRQIGMLIKNNDSLTYSNKASLSVLYLTNETLYRDLININITPNKSKTATCPSDYKDSSNFWRGVIDGDGSIFICKNNLYISLCGTRMICQSFSDYCRSIGCIFRSMVRSKSGYSFDFCEIQLCGKNAVKICMEIYKGNIELKLERKFQNFQSYLKIKNIIN